MCLFRIVNHADCMEVWTLPRDRIVFVLKNVQCSIVNNYNYP